jgi:predicted TIM-barrel fold metal-dependent hydrolase
MISANSIQLNDVDRRIWTEELDQFVPQRVFDVHTHIYRWEFNTDPAKDCGDLAALIGRDFPVAGRAELDAWDAALLPGRRVQRLSFGFPFQPASDFEASNRFVAQETRQMPGSEALMLVHPAMTPEYLEQQVRAQGFLGFKPYRFYARSGDSTNSPFTDFLPEEQIEVAHRLELIIMLHISKRDAIADPRNIDDLRRLTSEYPNVKWILAHCARSYAPWVIQRAADAIRGLPNVWYDASSVCDSDVIEALMEAVGPERVMYGSDDLPVGASRGKYITFGYAWAFLSESNHSLDLSHCNGQMTFVLYEQLRAMRRAAMRLELTPVQIDNLFYNTAAELVRSVAGM